MHLRYKSSSIEFTKKFQKEKARLAGILGNQLKKQIIKTVKNDRRLYTKLKSSFIKKILKKAKN